MPKSLKTLVLAALCLLSGSVRAADALVTRLNVPTAGKTGFTLIDAQKSGVRFTNVLAESRYLTNANLMNGSGVALGDFDQDGLCDIYLCSLAGSNVLYKNLGNWTFKEVTTEAGVGCAGQTSTGAVFADIDGDGDLDLLVTSMGGPNACLINDGHGHFTDQTAEAGLISQWGSSSMALADIDGNGTLDLYVCNYGLTSILRSGGTMAVGKNAKGEPVVLGRNSRRMKIIEGILYELGEPDILYLNDGKGHFKPARWPETFFDETGQPMAEAPWDQSLSVTFRDLNGDGFPDIYLCADAATPDRIWLNDGHGKFRAASPSAVRKTSYFTMGVDVADVDRDGNDDIFMVDMLSRSHERRILQQSQMHPQPNVLSAITSRFQVRRNVLLMSDGHGAFTEIGNYSGLAASDWTWSCIFLDVDLDGWEDVLITNGFERDMDNADAKNEISKMGTMPLGAMRRMVLKYPRLTTPNYAFQNLHNRTFREVAADWGFQSSAIGNGMALADLDNDGDLDVVVNCMNSVAEIYRNDSAAPRVTVRLKGGGGNTFGVGARITVEGGPVKQSQVIMAGGRYVSSDQPERTFAAGTAQNVAIQVDWPSGGHSEVKEVPANSLCIIAEPAGATPKSRIESLPSQSMFANEIGALNHIHDSAAFDDLARQPSLPRPLNVTGPAIAVADLNQDGLDDLVIGAGKSGIGAVLMNDGANFKPLKTPFFDAARATDAAILAFHKSASTTVVLRAESNYEDATPTDSAIHVFEVTNNTWTEIQTIRVPKSTIGALAAADLSGSNSLSLFVAGRCIPGQYPKAASSFVYSYNGKTFEIDERASKPFRELGLVTSAIFSDLNADGLPDLALSVEWSTVRVYMNNKGSLVESKIDSPGGLWLSVATGDFDNDGLPDIIAGNWGLNSIYNSRGTQRLMLYHGDLNEDGREAMLETYYENGRWLPFYDLGAVSKALPWVTAAFPTYTAFAAANADQILAGHVKSVERVETASLESVIFQNRTNHFERMTLPPEAQFSTANGATIGDFDGDGSSDVFIAQNCFGIRSGAERVAGGERLDAGRGLLLLGDGKGGFKPTDAYKAGILLLGQQSSSVASDFNNDGRLDLVVGQHSAATEYLRNQNARPGLRVKLLGPPGNLDAIGAIIRARSGERLGAAIEVQCSSAASGENSFQKILTAANPITAIHVLWPGGKAADYAIGANTASVTIDFEKGIVQP